MTIIGLERYKELKKENFKFVLLYILPTLVYGLSVFLFFHFSNRSVRSLFPILLTIISVIFITYIFYISFIPLTRFIHYKKVCKEVSTKYQIQVDIFITKISKNPHTVRGIRCVEISMIEESNNKELRRFLPIEYREYLKAKSDYDKAEREAWSYPLWVMFASLFKRQK